MRKPHLLIAFFVLSHSMYAQTNGIAEKQIDSLFAKYNQLTSGVAVAVVKDGKVVLSKGYGMANLEYDIPVTPRTVFYVASVSKQFTAFSIYLLEKRGKLSFEDDIRKYIPELPDYSKTIRIKHLLAHTSGIKDQLALLTLAGWRMDDVMTTEQILKILSRQKELNFETGSQYSYSNSGYTLLAEIVARITGKSFAQFTKEEIFQPLGMNNTLFYDDHEQIVKNTAYSYELKNGQYKKMNLNYSNVGPAGVFTTVEDLCNWTKNFEQPKVGDKEIIDRFNQSSTFDNGQRVLFSIVDGDSSFHSKGQFTRNYRGVGVYNHSGHLAGFRSFLMRMPDKHLSIITLSNDEHNEAFKNANSISEFYLKNELKSKPAVSNTIVNKPSDSAYKSNSNQLQELEGRFYNEELNTDYNAKVTNGKLFLYHTRLRDVELAETGKDQFSGTIEFPIGIDFVRDNDSQITGLRISNFGAKNVLFKKM
jgi:CubicO group peptidase (beta-lactamase class C family)